MDTDKEVKRLQNDLSVIIAQIDALMTRLNVEMMDIANGLKGDRIEQTVRTIEALFPADANEPWIAATGSALMAKAIHATIGWRGLPLHVLIKYADMCIDAFEQHGLNGSTMDH
jgi:hypothetical protein